MSATAWGRLAWARAAQGADGVRGHLGLAWRHRWVRLGTLATVLIVLGSLTPAYLPQNSPWWPPMRALHLDGTPGKVGGTLLVLTGLGLLTQAWLSLRHVVYSGVRHWAVLAWWSLPLLLAPPVFSHDAYSYAAQGWLAHNGLNPYDVGPGVLPGAYADQAPWVWRFTPTPYGPLAIRLQQLIVELCGHQPYWSAVAMRLPALVGVALIVALVPRIARRMGVDAQFAAWFAVLNPILVTDFVGGAHNDSLMVGLVLLGVWLAFDRRALVGAVVVGVAASIKQPAFLAAYALALVGHPVERLTWRDLRTPLFRVVVCCLTAITTFVVVSLACGLGFGWLHAVNVPGMVVTISPFTVVGQGVQLALNALHLDATGHAAIRASRTLGLLASAAIVGTLAVTTARRRPISFLSWSYLAVALCGPALHGWYVMWGGVLLPHTRPSTRVVRLSVWTSVALLSYAAINLSWRNGATALGVAALVVFAWLLTHHHRSGTLETPQEAPDA